MILAAIRKKSNAKPSKERRRTHDGASVGKTAGSVVKLSIERIVPADSDNERVYRPVDSNDPKIQELAESIRQKGLLEPILLSRDFFIISGHRRHCACKLIGLWEIPVRFADIHRLKEPDRFLKLLREANLQREKSIDEKLREALIDANPEECRNELIEYRRSQSKIGHVPISVSAGRGRAAISKAKADFLMAIQRVLDDRSEFWPLSDRQIHYALLNEPPLIHASKPNSRYGNTLACYKSLSELLTRARLEGQIHFAAISDETRPFTSWGVHREPGAFVASEVDSFLKGYYRDLMQSQPNHVEVVVEKNTVAGIVRPVCAEFCIPMTSGRGYCSLPPRHAMAERFRKSGKEKLVVLLVSDFDPDGEMIAESFARSMRDDFGVESIHPIKVALTADQVQKHGLPPSMEAKKSSSRTRGFVAKYGCNVWELEALPPETLQEIVRSTITDVIDVDLFNAEQRAEAADAAKLKVIRHQVQESLRGLQLDNSE